MKYGIPLGVLGLISIAAILHRTPQPAAPVAEKFRVTVDRRGSAMSASAPTEPAGLRDPESLRSVQVPMKSLESAAAPVSPAKKDIAWRKLGAFLEKSLELTSLQRSQVDDILRERDEEIRIWHEDIRKMGVLDIRTYEWKVGLLKSAWYRKLDSLLDGSQHVRFVSLVEQGFLNEGLAFTVEPGMTVLE